MTRSTSRAAALLRVTLNWILVLVLVLVPVLVLTSVL